MMAAPLSHIRKCPYCHRTAEAIGYKKSVAFVHERRMSKFGKPAIYDGCIIGYSWIRETAGNVTIIREGIARVVK